MLVHLYRMREKPSPRKSNMGRRYYQLISHMEEMVDIPVEFCHSQDSQLMWLSRNVSNFSEYIAYDTPSAGLMVLPGRHTTQTRHAIECIKWFNAGKREYAVIDSKGKKVYNYTGAPFILYVGNNPVLTLPARAPALSAQMQYLPQTRELGEDDYKSTAEPGDIPVQILGKVACDPLPTGLLSTSTVIVTFQYARFYPYYYGYDPRLFVPDDPVFDRAGNVLGYRGLKHYI